jgi:hypothetical protein
LSSCEVGKSFAAADHEEDELSKKQRIDDENRRTANADLLSKGFSASKRKLVSECTCSKCQSVIDGPRHYLDKKMLGAHGALKNVLEMKAEVSAHGIATDGMKKDTLKLELQNLIQKNGFFLTKAVAVVPESPDTVPAPTSPAANITRTAPPQLQSPGHFSPQVTPQKHREFRWERLRRKEEEGDEAQEIPDLMREGIADNPTMKKVYSLAFRAVTAKVLRYDDYLIFMVARDVTRVLTEKEWDNVLTVSFVLAQRLLDDYLDVGAEVARSVHASVRAHDHPDWDEYWPLGHHMEGVRAFEVDTAWAIQGYTSPHGVTHIQDVLTQLIIAVCQVTKHKDILDVCQPQLKSSSYLTLASSHIGLLLSSGAPPRHFFHWMLGGHGCPRHQGVHRVLPREDPS